MEIPQKLNSFIDEHFFCMRYGHVNEILEKIGLKRCVNCGRLEDIE